MSSNLQQPNSSSNLARSNEITSASSSASGIGSDSTHQQPSLLGPFDSSTEASETGASIGSSIHQNVKHAAERTITIGNEAGHKVIDGISHIARKITGPMSHATEAEKLQAQEEQRAAAAAAAAPSDRQI